MTKRKYQKQLQVDVPFDEALERFAQTDPAEVAEAVREAEARGSNIRGRRITEDDDGNICLSDLWELSGSPANARPVDWHRHKRTEALEGALRARMVEKLHLSSEEDVLPTYHAGKGRGAKSYAHPVLALDYAELLEPALGVEIREIFLRYRADDIGLANDILDRVQAQVREDKLRIQVRADNTVRNKELAKQGAKAGCKHWDYAELHNSGYRGLYNGLDADGIHRLKKLTKSQKILDHMTAAEGAANAFWATQAALRMEKERPKTPEAAFKIVNDAGVHTRKAMEFGGVMPEDMSIPGSISDARKRLEKNNALLKKAELPKKIDKKG